jgi:hypothetical protein
VVSDLTGVYRSFYHHSDYYDVVQRWTLWLKGDEANGADRLIVYDLVDERGGAPAGLTRRWQLHLDAAPVLAPEVRRAQVQLTGPPGDQQVDVVALLPATATLSHAAPEGTADDYPSPVYTHRLFVDAGHDQEELRFLMLLRAGSPSPEQPLALPIDQPGWVGVVMDGEVALLPRAAAAMAGGMTELSVTRGWSPRPTTRAGWRRRAAGCGSS